MYYTIYRITEGDTLFNIAERFNTSELLIKRHNPNSEIAEGVRLIIPAELGKRHLAAPFETLQKIADNYKVSVSELKNLNCIEDVRTGQTVIVPENGGNNN